MLDKIGFQVLIVIILSMAGGFFSAAELGIVSARRSRLEAAANAGNRGARQALELAGNPDRFFSTVQVGFTLINTFAAAFGGDQIAGEVAVWLKTNVPASASYADSVALVVVVALVTYLTLILSELVPKRLAIQHAERTATIGAPVLAVLSIVARPLVAVLSASVNVLLRLLRQRDTKGTPVTEEDIVYLVREGAASGTVEAGEAQFINRVFRFTDRPVRNVMTPRPEIVAVEAGAPLPEVIQAFAESGHSRLPVYQDVFDNVLGILHAKDLLQAISLDPTTAVDLKALVRPPVFVFEHQHIDDALALFRQRSTHMALVLDEYAQVAGLLTLTSVLEELVGDLPDEYEDPAERPFVQRPDGSWLVDGLESYDHVQERVGLPPIPPQERGDYNTLGGMILSRLGRIPQVGDVATVGDFTLEVVDMDGNRVDKVLIRRRGHAPAE